MIMGLGSFLKKLFDSGYDDDNPRLREARERHGIKLDEKNINGEDSEKPEPYDPWEDIRNIRSTFLFGGWVSRKFRPIGEDKLKKQLEELDRKREEEAKRKAEQEGEGN